MTSGPLRDPLWSNGEFRAFAAANFVERFAAAAITVMLAFHVYDVRNEPLDIALLGFVQVIPAVTLSLHGGDVADRLPRRTIVLVTTFLLAVLAAILALASQWDGPGMLGILLVAAFVSASLRAYFNPAAVGLEAQVLPVEQVLRGVPILSTTARIADMLGPVAMGFLWAWAGAGATYATLATLFAIGCFVYFAGIGPKPILVRGDGTSPITRIRDGIVFVFQNQVLIGSMALDLFAVFFGGAASLLPIFATDILDAGPQGFGLLRGAIAAGSLVAAFAAIRFMPKEQAGLALHGIIAGFGVSMIVFGLSTSFWLSMAALFCAGICDGLSMVLRHAILRLASPEHMRGRIAAVRMVFVGCSNELGAVQSGVMTSLLGPARAVVTGGMLTLAVVGVVAWRMPMLRSLDLRSYGVARTAPAE